MKTSPAIRVLQAQVIALQARATAWESCLLTELRAKQGQRVAIDFYMRASQLYEDQLRKVLFEIEDSDPSLAAELQTILKQLPER